MVGDALGGVHLLAVEDASARTLSPRHASLVSALAVDDKGELAATGGYDKDNQILLWRLRDGEAAGSLSGNTDSLTKLQFTRDGLWLLTGSADGTVSVWDPSRLERRYRFSPNSGEVTDIDCTSDGRLVAAALVGGSAMVWNIRTGAQVSLMKAGAAPLVGVSFSADDRVLSTVSQDGAMRAWDVRSGAPLASGSAPDKSTTTVAMHSPDRKTIVTGDLAGSCRLWRQSSATRIGSLVGHPGGVWNVAFFQDGVHLAVPSPGDDAIRVWEWRSGKLAAKLNGPRGIVRVLAVSSDGHYLAAGGSHDVVVWGREE